MNINFIPISLSIFISLCIMNLIKWNEYINFIGQYGKILWVLFSILILFIITIRNNLFTISNNLIQILFITLIFIFFSFNTYFNSTNTLFKSTFSSLIFIVYILYFYLVINLISNQVNENNKIFTLNYISNIIIRTIIPNVILWTIIGNLLLGVNYYDSDPTGSRSGLSLFTQDRMSFALLISTLFLTTFIHQQLNKNYNYYVILVTCFILIILSDSRTAQTIVLFFLTVYYLKSKIKYIEIIILLFITFLIFITLINNITFNIDYQEISSGRVYIWSLVLSELKNNLYLIGHGLFNMNEIILNKYISFNYYFQRIDFLYFHSSYIQILAAGGLIALLLFIIMITKIYFNNHILIKAPIIGICVGALFESFIVSPIIPISCFLWLIILIGSIKDKKL